MPRKILFVIPRNKSLFGDEVNQTSHPHVGVACLVSFLKEKGIQISIFDEGIEESGLKLIQKIDNFKPDLIGISIFSYSYGFAKNLLKIIKSRCDIPVVAGGPHVSAIRSEIMENAYIDFAIKDEGEYPLLMLIEGMGNISCGFDRINGLIWRKGKEVFENPDAPYIENLDALPFPDYEAFNIKRYPCYKGKTLPLITSRGCPFGCNYCSVRLSMGQRFRARSAENVFAEIQRLYGQGWRSFDINDDCFSLDKQRAEKICDLIIQDKLDIRFQLYNGIRADTVNPNLLRKMKRAGCYFISYGCEAGNNRILKLINKGITLEQVRDAVKWTNEAGIHNSVNFIIGHKEETQKDALDTINFAASLPTDFVNFYNLLPYPGTESFEWARKHAKFLVPLDTFLENISYRDNKPIFETNEFTRGQRERIVSLGFDLYRKKILNFRLGKILGTFVYWITKFNFINKLATRFALTNPLGKFIYIRLAKKSFMTKENNLLDTSLIR